MKTVTGQKNAVKPLRLDAGETAFIGVDVHKRTYHVAVWTLQRAFVATWVQPADPAVLLRKLASHRSRIRQVVYEAGPTGYTLARKLRRERFQAEVIAPSRIPSAPGAQPKSDRLDCRKLAEFAAKGLLRFVRVPTEQEESDRQILRLRGQMVRERRKGMQRIKSFLLQHGIEEPAGLETWTKASMEALRKLALPVDLRFALDVLLDDLDFARKQVARTEVKIREIARAPRHEEAVEALQTVPGVGPVTAMIFRTELVAPERFENSREVSRMLGLAPQVQESGQTRREGRLMKSGNGRIRTVLVEAAWQWVIRDAVAAKRYRRLVRNTGDSRKAIVGMARRLGIILWRISTRKEAYRAVA